MPTQIKCTFPLSTSSYSYLYNINNKYEFVVTLNFAKNSDQFNIKLNCNFVEQDQLPEDFERRASMDTNEGYTTKGSASSGVSSDLVNFYL